MVGEQIELLAPVAENSSAVRAVWRLAVLDGTATLGEGDEYRLRLALPFAPGDVFEFTTRASYVDPAVAQGALEAEEPYVVPNPYVGSSSFEPGRFAISGRGDRRVEFRAIPQNATIRIYTVRGPLVQTLAQDASTVGMVPWDLRTRTAST